MRGLFVAEGPSDGPLATIVEALFEARGCPVRLTPLDFERLREPVRRDVRSKVTTGLALMGAVDLIVVHRDADNAGWESRADEIRQQVHGLDCGRGVVPVIPVRMTEAWLLLDERAIRTVAGNPKGSKSLGLPKPQHAEGVADPKDLLAQALLTAADVTGRRRDRVRKQFEEHRRQLLERLDSNGPVTRLASWQRLVSDVARVADRLVSAG